MWLARDRTRTVDVTYSTASGEKRRLSFTAQDATADIADPLIGAVATQMSGGG